MALKKTEYEIYIVQYEDEFNFNFPNNCKYIYNLNAKKRCYVLHIEYLI